MNKKKYTPQLIDTTDVVLLDELTPLLEAMTKNVHEIWAHECICPKSYSNWNNTCW